MPTRVLTPEAQRLVAARSWVAERLAQHRENLAGWDENDGFLIPTEPDPQERDAVRRELRAAIAELDRIRIIIDSP